MYVSFLNTQHCMVHTCNLAWYIHVVSDFQTQNFTWHMHVVPHNYM